MKSYGFLITFLITAIFAAVVITGLFLLIESFVLDVSIKQILTGDFLLKEGIWVGVAFGMAFGFVNATSLTKETLNLVYEDRALFEVKMINIFVTMGYHPIDTDDGHYVFKPSGSVSFFAGKIIVNLTDGKAIITGPRAYIVRFRRKFDDDATKVFKPGEMDKKA